MNTKLFEELFEKPNPAITPQELEESLGDSIEVDNEIDAFFLEGMSENSKKALLEKIDDEPKVVQVVEEEKPVVISDKKVVKKETVKKEVEKESKVETKGKTMIKNEYEDLVHSLAVMLLKECQKSKVGLTGFTKSQTDTLYRYILEKIGE